MTSIAQATHHQGGRDAASAPLVVAASPAGHPYVRRTAAASGVSLLPDPPVTGRPAEVWWPPAVLDAAWIEQHRTSAQLLHIHFGTESFAPGHLTGVIDAAHAAGWPVVFTAHDLEHPQLGDQGAYSAQLDELMRGADAVITLTDGAADLIRARWDRHAEVIAHPSVLDQDAAAPRVRPSDERRIGVHLKDLRPNVDGPGTVRTLLESVTRLRERGIPAIAEVRMHHRVRDDGARDEVRRLCEGNEHAALIEHERLSDTELVIALSRLDACVLPYRHGTHSGWLELCWDLGVPVAAPSLGFYAEQHADDSVAVYPPADAAALTNALSSLVSAPSATRAGTSERIEVVAARRAARSQVDAQVAQAHAELYRALLESRAR